MTELVGCEAYNGLQCRRGYHSGQVSSCMDRIPFSVRWACSPIPLNSPRVRYAQLIAVFFTYVSVGCVTGSARASSASGTPERAKLTSHDLALAEPVPFTIQG